MSDDLKRVGLIFKADGTVDFSKSLKEVNASIKENRSEFELAKSSWDKSTSSLDKLRDRQKYLTNQTKDYSDKCKMINEQLEELENAEKRDEKAIADKKAQLNQAQKMLNNYEKGLKDVNEQLESGSYKMKDWQDNLESMSKKTEAAGKALTPLSAASTAVAAASVAAFKNLDDGYDTVIKKTGATGEAAEELKKNMDNVFRTVPTDAETAGIAIGEVNTRFGKTGEALENLSAEFIRFSEINDTDLNRSIDSTDAIMTKFNVDASQTKNVLGLITKAGQDTGLSIDTLYSSLEKNGATLKEMDFDLAESVNLLAQFEANGVDTSTALAGLKKAVANAAKEGKSADKALEETVENIKNASSETEALQIATELFGTKGAPEMTQAIREGRLSVDNLKNSLSEYGSVVEDTFNETLDPTDKAKLALNNLQVAGSELGDALLTTLEPAIDKAIEVIQGLTEWFDSLDDGQKQTISTILMIVAAIAPMLLAFSKVSGGIKDIVGLVGNTKKVVSEAGPVIRGVMTGIKSGAGSLFSFIAANPVILIIAGIIAAVVLLYTKCEWFRDGVNNIFGGIRDFIKNVVEKIKGFFDFEWELPKIKLPHFSVTGKFGLNPPSIPRFEVKWYANGGILNRPTIFGKNGDNLMGGGEAGPEAVLPINLLRQYIRDEMRQNNLALADLLEEAVKNLKINAENNIYIGDKRLYQIITEMVIKEISSKVGSQRASRGGSYV